MALLSDQSGIYFVYSSNKINVTKSVTLSSRDKSLNEVLNLLGKQVDMVFRIDGRHVTIKGDEPVATQTMMTPVKKVRSPEIASSTTQPVAVADVRLIRFYAPQPPPTSSLFASSKSLDKEFKRLQPYFDSNVLKRVPAHYVRKINSRNTHAGLFISAGATINDFSSGLEIQAGLRQIYAVYAPGWLRDGDFHGAYGLGSSFILTHNFSFNPVYLYGTISGSDCYYRISKYSYPSQVLVQHRVQHHQLKLMLQYPVTPNVVVKLGPTLNQLTTRYEYHETPIMVGQIPRGDPYNYDAQFHNTSYGSSSATTTSTSTRPSIYKDFRTRDFQVGWEASISFKLNFFPRKIVATSH